MQRYVRIREMVCVCVRGSRWGVSAKCAISNNLRWPQCIQVMIVFYTIHEVPTWPRLLPDTTKMGAEITVLARIIRTQKSKFVWKLNVNWYFLRKCNAIKLNITQILYHISAQGSLGTYVISKWLIPIPSLFEFLCDTHVPCCEFSSSFL